LESYSKDFSNSVWDKQIDNSFAYAPIFEIKLF